MRSFRVLVERQRADPIAAEFLSIASSAIRLRALRFSPLLITIALHHHENVRFRAARHLRYVRFGPFAPEPSRGAGRLGAEFPTQASAADAMCTSKLTRARNKPLPPISLWAKVGNARSCGYAVE